MESKNGFHHRNRIEKSSPRTPFPFLFCRCQEVHGELSREWMFKTLESFGLRRLDAEVYIYLLQHDPQKAREIAETLETYRRQLYHSLKSLRDKGMVNVSEGRPASFSAVSFDRVLDALIKANTETARSIEQNKDHIMSFWRSKIAKT